MLITTKERRNYMSRDRIIQLQECAEELGYSTIQEAIDAGYHEEQDLVNGTFTLKHTDAINAEGLAREQEKAHEAWLEEKEELLSELHQLKDMLGLRLIDGGIPYVATVYKTIKFIEGVSHE